MPSSTDTKAVFRKRLKQALKTREVSTSQAARDLGLSISAMQNYLKGLSLPPCSRMLDIARYFGRPIEYFLSSNEDTESPGSNANEYDQASNMLARIASELPEHHRYLLLDLAHELHELTAGQRKTEQKTEQERQS